MAAAITTTMATQTQATLHEELSWLVAQSRAPKLRTMRQFAEQELVTPNGQFPGQRWRAHRQPFTGLLLDAIDSRRWPKTRVVGCVQSGKSLHGYVLPAIYHLFEMKETAICGVPTMDVSKDKYREEILPVIRASRYRRYLPRVGGGSRGGTSNLESVSFTNGVTLKFMSSGGGDEKRSSFTSRVVVMTELDKMDRAGDSSRETDPISQIEARMASFDEPQRCSYGECTVSIPEGRIWQDYNAGTASRICCPCPACGEHVTPEREHLVGWKDATTKAEARRLGYFACPACGAKIDDAQRREMNLNAKLVHRGQTIDRDGVIHGPEPETDTLGFRWNAFNNLFWSTATIAAEEWDGAHVEDEENAKKKLLQFYWAQPYEPPTLDLTGLVAKDVAARMMFDRKGMVPPDAKWVTVGVDLGKYLGWWVAVAWRLTACGDRLGHILDYGHFDVPSQSMDVKLAIVHALREFRDNTIMVGWPQPDGTMRVPDQVWIDCGYQQDAVCEFCRDAESAQRFHPCKGYGAGQHYERDYSRPSKTNNVVRLIGEEYHVSWYTDQKTLVCELNSDAWKSWLHERLATDIGQSGAMTLYGSSNQNEHISLAKHYTAEHQEEIYIPGKGFVKRWERNAVGGRRNHWLDATTYACPAAHLCGFRLLRPIAADEPTTDAPPREEPKPMATPYGQPFMITERLHG